MLLQMFSKNLVSKPRDEDQLAQEEEEMQIDDIEQTRRADSSIPQKIFAELDSEQIGYF